MITRLQVYGQHLGFIILLGGITEAIWHQPQVHPLLSTLGYLIFGAFLFDLIGYTNAYHPLRGLLIAGLFGILQTTLMSGNLEADFPLGIAIYGAGISTLAFFTAYLIFFHPLKWGLGSTLVTGLLSGLWVYGAPHADLLDIAWRTPDLSPYLLRAIAILGLGLAITLLGKQNKYIPVPLTLMPPVLLLVGLSSVGMAIWQISVGNLSVLGIIMSLVVLVVLVLMFWFMYLNKLYVRTQTKQSLEWSGVARLSMAFVMMHAIGYLAIEAIPDLGVGIVIGLLIFGTSWLPFLSAALGFEAFVQLADEGIL